MFYREEISNSVMQNSDEFKTKKSSEKQLKEENSQKSNNEKKRSCEKDRTNDRRRKRSTSRNRRDDRYDSRSYRYKDSGKFSFKGFKVIYRIKIFFQIKNCSDPGLILKSRSGRISGRI